MHPVQFDVDFVESRSRLTTFFRLLLAIPHLLVAYLWAIPVCIVWIIAWFAILFTGKFPQGMWKFTRDWLTYWSRVTAYASLLADPFPPFGAGGQYPARLQVEGPGSHSRWKGLLVLLLAIPAYVVAYLLQLARGVVSILCWFIIVITGRQVEGLQGFMELCMRFEMRFFAYVLLLTDRYPSFATENATASPQIADVR